MFYNYPINITTKAMNEEALERQIVEIKKLNELGINWDLFYKVLTNAHNGTTDRNMNSFGIDGWELHYKNQIHPINVNGKQLKAIWEYIISCYTNIIYQQGKKYTLARSPNSDMGKFSLEYVVLKALGI